MKIECYIPTPIKVLLASISTSLIEIIFMLIVYYSDMTYVLHDNVMFMLIVIFIIILLQFFLSGLLLRP